MSATFADAARRAFALSARLLGWRPAEFWAATPAELAMALEDPSAAAPPAPPDRDLIVRMMECDPDG
ncbi:MAG: phage tail assembly chaperone [Erythrobacter sp.]